MEATLIFDGDCGFCTTTARWIERRWDGHAAAVPWQQLGERTFGLTPADFRRAAWWVDRRGKLSRGPAAGARALVASRGWTRPLGWLLLVPPVSWLARPGYWLVGRYRYRLPGSTDACRLPINRPRPLP